MDLNLAAIYNTPGAHTSEDQEKVAQFDLFAKLASDAGIDLNALNDAQVTELYAATMGKQASEEEEEHKEEEKKEHEHKEEEEKKAAAEAEFAVQKEWQEKQAEADHLGRLMAHAYVNELNAIKQASQKLAGKDEKEHDKEDEKHEDKKDKEHGKEEKHLPPFMMKKKEGSAIDELAITRAVEMASEAGFDVKEAASRVNAVLTLGLGESTKIAAAQDVKGATDIRALEYLEAAGYPVTWEQG